MSDIKRYVYSMLGKTFIYEMALIKDCGMSEWKIYSFGGHLNSCMLNAVIN